MIKDLTETFSPSGCEERIVKYLISRLSNVCDEIKTDNFGNLIATRQGRGENLCFECGMDSRGVMVVAKDTEKVYFAAVGNIKPENIVDKEIVFANGDGGSVKDDGENIKDAKISDLYIEMDTNGVNTGDFGVIKSEFCEDAEAFSAYGLSERIGVASVCEALSRLDRECGFTVLFSAQKRLGGRGIRAFFGANTFDAVITVDGCKENCDNGGLLIVKDAKAVAPRELRNKVDDVIAENNIHITPAVSETNFFMETISVSGEGNHCIGIGVPVQGEDKEKQIVKKADFDAVVELLVQTALNIQ